MFATLYHEAKKSIFFWSREKCALCCSKREPYFKQLFWAKSPALQGILCMFLFWSREKRALWCSQKRPTFAERVTGYTHMNTLSSAFFHFFYRGETLIYAHRTPKRLLTVTIVTVRGTAFFRESRRERVREREKTLSLLLSPSSRDRFFFFTCLLIVGQNQTNTKWPCLRRPRWPLFFYYKDIKQEIVHTLLLKKCDVSKLWVIIVNKEVRQKCAFGWGTSGPPFGSRPVCVCVCMCVCVCVCVCVWLKIVAMPEV